MPPIKKTVRVKMKTLGAGPGGVREPGTEHDVPKSEGDQLVNGNYADLVKTAPKSDKAE